MKKLSFVLIILICGCSATEIKPEAARIRITTNEPVGCQYLGEVTGNQGNSFTGGWTSNANLEIGARNDLKNQAYAMGGNLIHMLTNRAGQTGSGGMYGSSSEQTNVVYVGAVYRCPPDAAITPNKAAPLRNQRPAQAKVVQKKKMNPAPTPTPAPSNGN